MDVALADLDALPRPLRRALARLDSPGVVVHGEFPWFRGHGGTSYDTTFIVDVRPRGRIPLGRTERVTLSLLDRGPKTVPFGPGPQVVSVRSVSEANGAERVLELEVNRDQRVGIAFWAPRRRYPGGPVHAGRLRYVLRPNS